MCLLFNCPDIVLPTAVLFPRYVGRVFFFLSLVSAPSLVSIGEKGARFKSYHDCSIKSLTPERSIEIQRQLGADLVVVLGKRKWSREWY